MTQKTWAFDDRMEEISGADQSYTYGYGQAQEVRRFEEGTLTRRAQEAAVNELQPKALTSG